MNINNNIFSKILNNEIKSDIIYKNKYITAFNDIKPQAPIHIIVIPNIYIKNINNINKSNIYILSKMLLACRKIAKFKNINKSGYRLIINCNKDSGQEINYLHIHIIGGKFLGNIICNCNK